MKHARPSKTPSNVLPFRVIHSKAAPPPDPCAAVELLRMARFVLTAGGHRAAALSRSICSVYYPAVTERSRS